MPTPSLKALMVSDTVIEDRHTGKKSIIGAFTNIDTTSFPCVHPQMGVYFCISDAEGEYEFKLDLVYINRNESIGNAVLSGVQIDSRLDIVDFGLLLPPVQFHGAGRYEFRLYANNEFVGNKDFTVTQKAAEG